MGREKARSERTLAWQVGNNLVHSFNWQMFSEPGPAKVKLLGRERETNISDWERGKGNEVCGYELVYLWGQSGGRLAEEWYMLVSKSICVLTPSFHSHLLSNYYV